MPSLRAPRALLFDLDGTLIDSRGDIAAACNFALVRAGRAPLSLETISTMVGDGSRALLSRAFDVPPDAGILESALDDFLAFYKDHPAEHSTLLPGAKESLADTALPVALVTNKSRGVTLAVLEALGIGRAFASIVAGGDGPLKPAPDPVRRAAREVGVAPEDAWMIGDGPQDAGAAHAAGAVAIAVRGGFLSESRVAAERPDAWIDSLLDLPSLVKRGAST